MATAAIAASDEVERAFLARLPPQTARDLREALQANAIVVRNERSTG